MSSLLFPILHVVEQKGMGKIESDYAYYSTEQEFSCQNMLTIYSNFLKLTWDFQSLIKVFLAKQT